MSATRENLFEIIGRYHADLAKLSDTDLPPEAVLDTMEAMQGDVEEKLRAVVAFARQLDADAEIRKSEAKRMADGAKALQNRADQLLTYAQIGLMNSGLKLPLRCPEFTLNLAKMPPACDIKNAEEIPGRFKRLELSAHLPQMPVGQDIAGDVAAYLRTLGFEVDSAEVLDKRSLLDALKAGEEVPGATLMPQAFRLSVR